MPTIIANTSYRRRTRCSWESSLTLFLLFIFIIVVFGPLLALVLEAAQYSLRGSNDWFELLVPAGRRLTLLIHSLELAAGVALSCMIIGLLAAIALWNWRTGILSYLRWFLLAMTPIPPYIHALAWSSAIATLGSAIEQLGFAGMSLTGWIGAWWVQFLAMLPVAVGFSLLGLESVEMTMIEAARLMRSDMQTLARIVLPLAAPAILAGAGFLFVLSLVDYSVPSLFSVNVYPLEIFAEYSASNQPARALFLAQPILLFAIVVTIISQAGLRNTAQISTWGNRVGSFNIDWPKWFVWAQRVAVTLLVVQIAVIAISLLSAVETWENMVSTVAAASNEIAFTFWIASTASLLCLPIAFVVAEKLLPTDRCGRLWWLLVTAPLAIPAPLIGIGLISIWNHPFWAGLYGSSLMPVLASMARFAPFAALVLLAQLRHVDPLLIDAARVFHTNTLRTWLYVRLPMLAPGVLAASAVVFALTAGELGATLIVAPPGQATLTMRIYNYLHYGASSVVAGLCLMMVVSALVAGGLAIVALFSWSRILSGHVPVRYGEDDPFDTD